MGWKGSKWPSLAPRRSRVPPAGEATQPTLPISQKGNEVLTRRTLPKVTQSWDASRGVRHYRPGAPPGHRSRLTWGCGTGCRAVGPVAETQELIKLKCWSGSSQSGVPGTAAPSVPGNLLGRRIPRPQPDLLQQDSGAAALWLWYPAAHRGWGATALGPQTAMPSPVCLASPHCGHPNGLCVPVSTPCHPT